MVEKIIINPNKVRGYGNIMSPHSSSDYELEDCTIATGTDTVNGATETVYTLTPTASHSYSLSFGSASYTATGGSVTVTVTLTDGGVAVNNATISVSGGSGGSGTGTTNSSGVATINVTGVTASGTLTASFSGVTATASVTYQQYIFYDSCATDNTSNWSSSTANAFWEAVGNTYSLSFDTDHYVFSHSLGSFLAIRIPGMTASLDNYVLSADILANGTNTDYGGGLSIIQDDNKGVGMVQPNSTSGKHTYLYSPQQGSGSVIDQTVTSGYTVGAYHHHKLTKTGTTIKYEISYNSTVLFTNTKTNIATNLATQTIPAVAIGRWDTAKFKNIKIEPYTEG